MRLRSSSAGPVVGGRLVTGQLQTGAPLWTPARIAGARLWLRADLGITTGTGGVSAWADQTGHQPAFAQATAGMQPVLTRGAINGQPAVTFNGVAQFLQCPAFVSAGLTDAEVWMVAQATALPVAAWDLGTAASGNWTRFTDGHMYDDTASTTRPDCGAIASGTVLAPFVIAVKSAAGARSIYVNGTTQFTTGTNVVALSSNPTLGVSLPTIYFTGLIAEVGVSPIMGAVDRARTRAYLASRYGLTLGGDWM